jgi:Ca-activated chloride channel family protein
MSESALPQFRPEPTDDPAPSLWSERGALPLRAVSVKAHVAGATARVQVEQTYESPYDEPVEVSYVFPLPDAAAVTRCELRVGGRVVEAKLKERGEAREAYAEAVAQGKRAALAEQERQGVFTVTLGNLQPRERATVRFELCFPLPREDGRHTLRFPLVVGERYTAGAAPEGLQTGHGVHRDTDAVPDASRVSPPRLAEGAERPDLAIEVVLEHGELGITQLESSLHAVTTTRTETQTTVRLVAGQALDRDFVLRFRLGDDQLRTQLCLAPDDAGDEGTFQLTVLPPAAPVRARPRDVVVLLDRSGSMSGWKIVAARRALARLLDGLDAQDRLAAYAFGSQLIASAELAHDRLHAATARTRARAADFLTGVQADGGTELLQALEQATQLLAVDDPTRDRWLVLVTDGQVSGEDELVARVAQAPGVRVLALGIDDAVNGALLKRLARSTGGRLELVQKEAELEDALDRLHLLLGSPALERVTVRGEGGLELVPGTRVPPGLLHAFPGVPLVVRGRYRGGQGAVQVQGQGRAEPFSRQVRGRVESLPSLRACWAREQLLALEDQFAAGQSGRDALIEEMVATSLKFGVLCRFTAFVAVDDAAPAVDVAERHVQQPVEPTRGLRLPALDSAAPVSRYGGQSGSQRASKTQAGVLRGKFNYMSPEQIRGLPLEPRSEVFSLGLLFGELVTGERFYVGESDFSILEKIRAAALDAALFPPERAWLFPLVRRAMERDVEDRFDSPGAFADALEALGQPIASRAELAAWAQAQHPGPDPAAERALVAAAQPPQRGYALLKRLHVGGESEGFLAARLGPAGNEAVFFQRLRPELTEDEEYLAMRACEATLPVEGMLRTFELGTDRADGFFLAREYVAGVDVRQLFNAARQAKRLVPLELALGLFVQAARALEAALHLRDPVHGEVGVILRNLAPDALRLGFDGRAVWLGLGAAPTPHFQAPRRSAVPLTLSPGLSLTQAQAALPALAALPKGRWVVVPRQARVQTVPARPKPSLAHTWNPPAARPPPPQPTPAQAPPAPPPEAPARPAGLATRLSQWWKGK